MNETGIRVLLVEDNPSDVGLVRAELADVAAGQFELTHVKRLSEAEQRLREECYDVILLNLSLPDAHELATLTGLRQHESYQLSEPGGHCPAVGRPGDVWRSRCGLLGGTGKRGQ